MDINLKSLLARLNRHGTKALEAAAGACVAHGHHEVEVEHLLIALLDDPSGDVGLIATHVQLDAALLRNRLAKTLAGYERGNQGRPVFSPLLLEWLKLGWLSASLDLHENQIRTGALLLALVSNTRRLSGGDYDEMLAPVKAHELQAKFRDITSGSPENAAAAAPGASGSAGAPAPTGDGTAIAQFCTDFTAKAKAGKIDAVFGRDREIRQIIDILARRRKNNPICVGEPGVGKTAVVEGLALRVIEGDVPDSLKGVQASSGSTWVCCRPAPA